MRPTTLRRVESVLQILPYVPEWRSCGAREYRVPWGSLVRIRSAPGPRGLESLHREPASLPDSAPARRWRGRADVLAPREPPADIRMLYLLRANRCLERVLPGCRL